MEKKISVLIVDDNEAVEKSIVKLMEFHPEIVVIGGASTAQEAIAKVKSLHPDIVLMDINMPGMDGITATGIISAEVPATSVIMMSVQAESEYLRSSMVAGVRNYLTKPFTSEELIQAIKQVNSKQQKRIDPVTTSEKTPDLGKVITVFSTKGGVGKTTIVTNLATALSLKTGVRVAIVDMDLEFGDVAIFLNIVPRTTMIDLVRDIEHIDGPLLEMYMIDYGDKLKVLAAPLRPGEGETITGNHLATILNVMRQRFDYIIIDTAPAFDNIMLAALDASDQVLVVAATDLATIKNVKLGLDVMKSLGYKAESVKTVLNRADSVSDVELRDVEQVLDCTFVALLPTDGRTVVASVNRGVPFVISNPDTNIAQGIFRLANIVAEDDGIIITKPKAGLVHKLQQLLS